MTAALANVIRKRSRAYAIQRRSAITVNPNTGLGQGGSASAGTLRCHVQPYTGPARTDGTAGVSTAGRIKIWVPDDVHVILDEEDEDVGELRADPGEGGSGQPGDVLTFDGHHWLVVERSNWVEDGSHREYIARDEGAAS